MWRRQRQSPPQPDLAAKSIAYLSKMLELDPAIEDTGGQLRGEVRIVPAGFPQTNQRVWLVLAASSATAGDVHVELATALASGGEARVLAEIDCHWEGPEAEAPASWTLASIDPALAEEHSRRGPEGALLELVRDRLVQIRDEELAARPALDPLAAAGAPAAPSHADDLRP
jgi:hypothetical protein